MAHPIAVNLKRLGAGTGKRTPSPRARSGHKSDEFLADFYLVSKRHLSESDWQFFKLNFLMGGEEICKRRMTASVYANTCARIETALGRVFRELEPFPLHPLDEYFSPVPRSRKKTVTAFPATPPARYQPLRPPMSAPPALRKAA
jgi:hypothetical protein